MSSPLGILVSSARYDAANEIGKHIVYSATASVGTKVKSLFGRSVFSPFPDVVDKSGNVASIQAIRNVHSDKTYDTSVSSLVEYTSNKPAMRLRFADFAYLKNLGVYPNNRLIVARRFSGPVGNDLTKLNSSPLATMISWYSEDDTDFFSLKFNEEWEPADADFTNVLNDMGDHFKATGVNERSGSGLGNFLGGGLNLLNFGQFSEPLQRLVFAELGLVNDPLNLPLGNPNLIREAKRRKVVSKGEAESGLACEIDIKMEVEYEQKFINNVDPTIVYLDIIQNALTFGTSDAQFQFSGGFANLATGTLAKLASANFGAIFEQLKNVVNVLFNKIKGFAQEVWNAIQNPAKVGEFLKNIVGKALNIAATSVGAIVGKFKVKLMGIINALTGSPSCPWHLTIGNPKRPFFSSGDMLLSDVSVEFGSTLAFNDLPSTIKFVLNFKNARPLGANEIFNRLNTGKGRSYLRVHMDTKNPDQAPPTDEINDNDIRSGSIEEVDFRDKKNSKGSSQEERKVNEDVAYASIAGADSKTDWHAPYIEPTTGQDSTVSSQYANPEMPVVEEPEPPVEEQPPAEEAPPAQTAAPSNQPQPESPTEKATRESTKGYIYTMKITGPKRRVVVTTSVGQQIYEGYPTFSTDIDDVLVNEAKSFVGDTGAAG